MAERRARLIAYYLPQFHPIPENDQWWGKGFTEWTNVARAKPLFRGHWQPNVPADLGFYDLRVAETREAQADLARSCGIEAFLYWHYWFAGERLLERPFKEVLESGKPDFPFCLGWANETWSGIWYGARNRILKEQTYPGEDDYRRHFDFLLTAFNDRRYVRVDNKPILGVFRPTQIPDGRRAMDFLRGLAEKAGLAGLYIVGVSKFPDWEKTDPAQLGIDAMTSSLLDRIEHQRPMLKRRWLSYAFRRYPKIVAALGEMDSAPRWVYSYEKAISRYGAPQGFPGKWHPVVMPNWDNTPRSQKRGMVLQGSTPELFRRHLQEALRLVDGQRAEEKLIFVKSWNEWAEGNYLEPDLRWGTQYIEVVRDEVLR